MRVEGAPFWAMATGPEKGPLALFLHGFPDVPSTWEPVMERFAKTGYRCVAPWMRGYAPSTLEGPFDLERLGRDVLAIAHELAPRRRVFLVGHDWGAAATWWAMMRAGHAKFAAATTIAVPHPRLFARALRSPMQLMRSRYMAFFQVAGVAERSLDREYIEELWRRWSPGWEPDSAHLDEVERTLRESVYAPLGYYRAMLRPRRLVWLRFVDSERAMVHTPTLHLHGLDDGCIGADLARGQERFFDDVPHRLELLHGAGHFAHLERPDAVAERAIRFFRVHAPEAA